MLIGRVNFCLRVYAVLVAASMGLCFVWQTIALYRFAISTIFAGNETHLVAESLVSLIWFVATVLSLGLFLMFILLLVSRWRKPVLFISYQKAHEAMADRLQRDFKALGHEVLKLGFDPRRAHDPTVSAVRKMVTKCDAVVAVPSDAPSFMDTELARAETLGKGIVIARHLPDQRAIGAIQQGYPQIALQRLLADPAAGSAFLCWAMFDWKTSLEPLRQGVDSGLKWFVVLLVYVAFSFFLALLVGVLIGGIAFVFSGTGAVFSLMAGRWVELLTILVFWPVAAFFISWQAAVTRQIKTHGLVHQTFLSGNMTEKILRDTCKSSDRMRVALAALIPVESTAGGNGLEAGRARP